MISLGLATYGYRSDGATVCNATKGYRRQLWPVQKDTSLLFEYNLPLVFSLTGAIDFQKSLIISDYPIPFDFLNFNNLVIKDVVINLDDLLEFVRDIIPAVDFNVPVTFDQASPVEILPSVYKDTQLLLELLQTINYDRMLNIGLDKDFQSSTIVPISMDKAFSMELQTVFELLATVTKDVIPLVESYGILNADKIIPIGISGGWGKVVFQHPASAVHFYRFPVRPATGSLQLRQIRGRADGIYVYNKSIIAKKAYPLIFMRIDGLTLDSLLYFFENVAKGKKEKFTYWDAQNNPHTIRFTVKKLSWQRVGPDRYDVECPVEEEV